MKAPFKDILHPSLAGLFLTIQTKLWKMIFNQLV